MGQRGQHEHMQVAGTDTASGALSEWSGIVTGTLRQWARAAETSTEAVEQALRNGAPDPLVDTADPKGRESRSRPDDPTLRSVAFAQPDARIFLRILRSDDLQ